MKYNRCTLVNGILLSALTRIDRHMPRAALALSVTAFITLAYSARAQSVPPSRPADRAEHHEFTIENFRTESGVTLPQARIVYGTYGHLNAARDNVILLPSHYMATHHGYEWLIGPGKALDTTRFFLVATELFGNGKSSSPSNTPEPFHGPRFPVTTIRDNVAAERRLLTEALKVTHLRAVIGFSMGAQQAFQWAVSAPGFVDRIVATSGTAKTYGHGIVRNEGQIAAIMADPVFNNGDYTAQPKKGIEAFSLMWAGWLYSQEWWRRELWRTNAPAGTTLDKVISNYRTNFISGADANDLILQLRTWQQHDVGKTPGFDGDIEKALRSITMPVLYMPSETDLYFPVGDARYEAQFIPQVTLTPIPSLWGHPAGAAANPADAKFLNDQIARFLNDGGSLPGSWYAGGATCGNRPPFEVHEYDANFFILRQAACTNYEKPFLYLLFGSSRALLLDTGAGGVDIAGPIDTLIAAWRRRHGGAPVDLVVAHSHAHGDHVAGDSQFVNRPNITLVGRDSAAVRSFFAVPHWPDQLGLIDLGDRTIDVIPIPGHEPAGIALFDRRTGVLLTGDTFYPGRLYVRDTAAFAASISRLAAFVRTHNVTHLLGTHIENTRTPYVDYPVGTVDQPNEHALDLGHAQLFALDSTVQAMRGRFTRTVLPDLTVWPRNPTP